MELGSGEDSWAKEIAKSCEDLTSTPDIMVNSSSLILALALFIRCSVHSATFASPTGRMDEGTSGQEGLRKVLGDDAVVKGALQRRFPLIEGRLADEDGTKRIFILSDLGLDSFGRGFPMWRADRRGLKDERRDADDLMAKRDLDMLRCMIGRVYRPCWQA